MKRFPESPEALRALSEKEAEALCADLREFLVDSVLNTGGHLASNLGVVEISVALLRTFDPLRDRIVYDTGHQCYVHKILTGREEAFSTLRSLDGISGFPCRAESEFDAFGTGHSGTGISAALGFAKAARLRGEKNWSVAVVGDGAFTGGMIFEALNNIARDDRVIIILNDNGMSISKSVGAVKRMLGKMRTRGYYRFKGNVRGFLARLPLLGRPLTRLGKAIKDRVKRHVVPQGNVFEEYGLSYFGPADGNDLRTVEFLLNEAKKKDHSSLIHLCTKKGKGYRAAEKTPSDFHGVSPAQSVGGGENFSSVFGRALLARADADRSVAAITAAMTDGVGLKEFAKKYPQRLFDVGIAEEHAMTFAAALAAGGMKPVFAVYSTFFQRCVDQLIHDAALQKLPAVLALDRAGITGEDGATHQGVFDVALSLPCPGVKIYSPAAYRELEKDLDEALAATDHPSILRYPKGAEDPAVAENFPLEKEIEEKVFLDGRKCAIIGFGRTVSACLAAAKLLEAEGIGVTVIRFGVLKGYDEAAYRAVFDGAGWENLLFAEEGVRTGSFSEALLSRLSEEGRLMEKKTSILAVPDAFVPHGRQKELLARFGLTPEGIAKEVRRLAQT